MDSEVILQLKFERIKGLKVYLATDDKESAILACNNEDINYHIKLTDNKSLNFSKPGKSAANNIIRDETQDLTYYMAIEIIIDIILLSRAKVVIGLLPSQITRIASFIGHSRWDLKMYTDNHRL